MKLKNLTGFLVVLVVIVATSIFCFGLEKANSITARLKVENPKRHIGYTISILINKF